jgi:hypothetical protein
MSTSSPCNCDDALRWKRRALAAEMALAFAKRQIEMVVELMPACGATGGVGRDAELVSGLKGAVE